MVAIRASRASSGWAVLLCVASVAASAPDDAEPAPAPRPDGSGFTRDRSARKMIKRAIDELYLRVQIDEAEHVLLGTVEACMDRCRPATLALAHMYLGIVRGSGRGDADGARKAFEAAFAEDPKVELDRDLATDEMVAVFAEVESAHSSSAEPATDAVDAADGGVDDEPRPPVDAGQDDRTRCPPEFPGCAAAGEKCKTSADCMAGLACESAEDGEDATCHAPPRCTSDESCDGGRCRKGSCVAEAPFRGPRNFVSLHTTVDLAQVPGATDVCSGAASGSRYQCFAGERGLLLPPAELAASRSHVAQGLAPAAARFSLGYERAASPGLRLGGRLGFALGGAPEGFLPVHAELRLRALLLDGPIRPYFAVATGMLQLDAHVQVEVQPPADANESLPPPEWVDAYVRYGRAFVAPGAGVLVELGPAFAVDAGIAGTLLFPDSGFALSPSLGGVVAF